MPKTLPKCKHGLNVSKCVECSKLYQANWWLNNKDRLKESRHVYYQAHSKKEISDSLINHKKGRNKVKAIIGDKCIICNSIKRLCFHEIHGIPHKSTNYQIYLKNPQNFIPLCYYHHKIIHALGDMSIIQLIKALKLMELLRNKL